MHGVRVEGQWQQLYRGAGLAQEWTAAVQLFCGAGLAQRCEGGADSGSLEEGRKEALGIWTGSKKSRASQPCMANLASRGPAN